MVLCVVHAVVVEMRRITPPKIPFTLLELCPRGNNKDIIIILVHDKVYIPC
jgi:hypothetical protein